MTDHLFAEIAANGFFINNLYQADAALWRCSLRKPTEGGDLFTSFAEAPTLEAVLEEALEGMAQAEFFPERPISSSIDLSKEPSLLEALGIKPTLPPLSRRPL